MGGTNVGCNVVRGDRCTVQQHLAFLFDIAHIYPSSYNWNEEFMKGSKVTFMIKAEGGRKIAKYLHAKSIS